MNIPPPKIAVLLATYNGEKYIESQITSILSQIDVELDIYVSDDGSNDNTLNILNQFKSPNIKIFSSREKSRGAGYNFLNLIECFPAEDYDFISFADQDDLWFNNKLIEGVRALRNNFSDGYSSNVIALWEDGKKTLVEKAYPQKKYDFAFESAGPGCTYIINKILYRDFREYLILHNSIKEEIWMHDWFIYAFARGSGYSWFIDEHSYMYYRQHSSNLVGANYGLNSLLVRMRLVSNGLYGAQCSLIINSFIKNDPFNFLSGGINFYNRIKFLFQVKDCRRKFSDRILLGILVIFFLL